MKKYYIKTAFKNLIQHKQYMLINIFGLTLSFVVVLATLFWLYFELSVDDFHKDKKRIYQISNRSITPNKTYNTGHIYAPAGPEFQQSIPEIQAMARLRFNTETVNIDQKLHQLNTLYAEPDFFNIFDFKLIQGNQSSCLNSNQNVVLTKSMAIKLFGTSNALNKELLVNKELKVVSGILEDLPKNTDFSFELILPTQVILDDPSIYKSWNGGIQFYTFIKIAPEVKFEAVQQKITDYVNKKVNEPMADDSYSDNPYLQNLSSLHFSPETSFAIATSFKSMWITVGVAFLILLIGIVNFVNLSFSLIQSRFNEFYIKTVHGATKKHLFTQVMLETALITLISVILALILLYSIAPWVNTTTAEDLTKYLSYSPQLILTIILTVIVTIFLSGYFIAYKVAQGQSSFKKGIKPAKNKGTLMHILIGFQFSSAIILVIVALFFYKQLDYIKHFDLGFSTKNLIEVTIPPSKTFNHEVLQQEIAQIPGVLNVSAATNLPYDGKQITSNGYSIEGSSDWIMSHVIDTDAHYVSTLGLELITGTYFKGIPSDQHKIVVNEALVSKIGWEIPLGKKLIRNGNDLEIIGVVKDFSFSSMHHKIEPLLFTTTPWEGTGDFGVLAIKIADDQNKSTILNTINTNWKKLYPNDIFEMQFLDTSFNHYYKKEKNTTNRLLLLCVLAIFISCIGLYTMSHVIANSNTKEIGIRKVNGASIASILLFLNKNYGYIFLIASTIAIPISLYSVKIWMQNYAYKTTLNWWVFLVAILLSGIIALLTISWQSYKAATRNPVEALRDE